MVAVVAIVRGGAGLVELNNKSRKGGDLVDWFGTITQGQAEIFFGVRDSMENCEWLVRCPVLLLLLGTRLASLIWG